MSSNSNSGARPDTNPGSSIPQGPSRTQPATNNQKDFADQLGVSGNMPAEPTKGEASDVISNTLNNNNKSSGGSGAAPDDTPGNVKPTGPSAKQPATNNQKGYLNAVGANDGLTDSTTKGQASDTIEKAMDGGARPPQGDGQGGAGASSASSGGRSGAAQDTTPGSQVPTGPSAKQPATNNQKTLINSLGASDQISNSTTKGEASDIISKNQS